eukprot:CAMPEP_0197467154 /NCGR_PEP_ID=MMETSP1175-20131217/65421_1 /TAXON_ID=1003142 /ORGANISM="Triceratium dubium, Strain CCMP147" /LENGTH=395 /DNA_ID=CAMNT_0043003217 /DNA_START=366 /DNA_END=1555 /DNA_ORIENTATION=+
MAATFVNPFMTLPQIALVWSTAVTSAILFTSPLSGAHLNPAFTIAQAMFRSFDWRKVLPYIGAQLVGSMAGSALSFEYFRSAIEGFEQAGGLTHASSIDSARVFGEYFDPSLTATQAFGVEAAGTALLAAVVFAVTHEKNSERNIPVPFVVGGAVFSLINVLAPFSQCGLNPARDFGPRIIAFIAGWTDVAFQNCWLYIAAPILGAITGAALIDKILYYPKRNEFQKRYEQIKICAHYSTIVFITARNYSYPNKTKYRDKTNDLVGEYFDPSLTATQAFGVEAAGTALLATIVFGVTHEKNSDRDIPVPFVVGATVFLLINVFAPFTQCGLNPARDFGPRIVAFFAGWTDVAFQNCWLYIAAPIIGAIAGAALIDKILYPKRDRVPKRAMNSALL